MPDMPNPSNVMHGIKIKSSVPNTDSKPFISGRKKEKKTMAKENTKKASVKNYSDDDDDEYEEEERQVSTCELVEYNKEEKYYLLKISEVDRATEKMVMPGCSGGWVKVGDKRVKRGKDMVKVPMFLTLNLGYRKKDLDSAKPLKKKVG